MDNWELISLETDDSAELIGEYFEQELGYKIRRVKEFHEERKRE